jgi:hypothetical protein
MKLTIKITKEVLERSKMCGIVREKISHARYCGIAVAVNGIFPGAIVKYQYIILPIILEAIALPDSATEFICEFDRSTPEERTQMHPFSFEIDVPDSVIERIGIEEARAIIAKSETLELAS